jgi:beta-glucosidase
MRAHGRAVQAYRAEGRHAIGLVVNIEPKYPATQSPADLAACNRDHAYMNRQYLDPALLGTYPQELREIFGDAWPEWPDEDMDLIRQPLDFIGLNWYTRGVVRHDDTHYPLKASRVQQKGATYTDVGWEVYPQGLTDTLVWMKQRYGDLPIYITENGAAFYDPPVAQDGAINDPLRVAYLRSHLKAAHAAIEQGVDLRGYFAWSLLDNLEWSLGYSKRFGLIHVDFESQARTLKDSALLYRRIIASGGAELD